MLKGKTIPAKIYADNNPHASRNPFFPHAVKEKSIQQNETLLPQKNRLINKNNLNHDISLKRYREHGDQNDNLIRPHFKNKKDNDFPELSNNKHIATNDLNATTLPASAMVSKEMGQFSENILEPQIVNIETIKGKDPQVIINEIKNYVEQFYIRGASNLNVVVNHNKLGQFRIMAQRMKLGEQINLQIEASSEKGRAFFSEHEAELIKSLNKNGVKLSNFKFMPFDGKDAIASNIFIPQDMMAQNEMHAADNAPLFEGQSSKGYSQEELDSERRRNLWQQFKEWRDRAFA